MNQVDKFLKKLSPKEKIQALELANRLLLKEFSSLNIKRLKGHSGVYRVRKGRLRIIFRFYNNAVDIIYIGLRDEDTYKL